MGTLKKKIGNKETEVYAEQVYSKLFAFGEILFSHIEHNNSLGTYYKGEMDNLIYGLKNIYDDILTEVDQLFINGVMESDFDAEEDATPGAPAREREKEETLLT